MLERLPFEQLHGDEVLAIRFVDFTNGANVRVIERGGSEGFALKSLPRNGIVLHFSRKKLQRDMAAECDPWFPPI
jgi:hypothetical protein